MEIRYSNKKLEKQCTDIRQAKRDFEQNVAIRLHKAIFFIEAAESLESVINFGPMRFHKLKGNYKGFYAVDIAGKKCSYRLLLSFDESDTDVFPHAKTITLVQVEEVSNHYE